MSTITLRGIQVSFPFEPYEIQKQYMEKVIECLQNKVNGVLESPTGTGKTLSLLCASLAWLTVQKTQHTSNLEIKYHDYYYKKKADNLPSNSLQMGAPKIIYASRTHSQLAQAMQELKRTEYKHMKANIMGSREQTCIHPEVSKLETHASKTVMCHALVKSHSCRYQNKVEKMSTSPLITQKNVMDIEDLVKLGHTHNFCPYYMSKELQKDADILFLPYNYLLDPKLRRTQTIDLNNSIIILDEAHNVERVCEDSTSFQIKSSDITLCIQEVTEVMKDYDQILTLDTEQDFDFSQEELISLKEKLLKFEVALDNIQLENVTEGETFGGKYIFSILEEAGIDSGNQNYILSLLDRVIQFLSVNRDTVFKRSGNGLKLLQDLLLLIFIDSSEEFRKKIDECFKVHIIDEDPKSKKMQVSTWITKTTETKKKSRVLSYWCFSPAFSMQMLFAKGLRCLILTSGTLAPLKPLISELGIDVKVRLENPHVITKEQICVKIVPDGPDGESLNGSYVNRDNPKYLNSLGNSILNISRFVPNGLLIFFPSYPLLEKCQKEWQGNGVWSSLKDSKEIFIEPRNKDVFVKVMQDFYDRVKNPNYNGATFMAVCRGKVSEGLDFADINGRAVIVIGLPYPPLKDPRIVLKKKYLDLLNSRDREYLRGQDWYCLEATRAVNQAIGRVIRHKHDYGAIFLLDSRFRSSSVRGQLSLWLRDHIKLVNSFGEIIRDIRTFFKNANSKFPLVERRLKVEAVKEEQPHCSTQVNNYPNNGLIKIHKRGATEKFYQKNKKLKHNLMQFNYGKETAETPEKKDGIKEYIVTLKSMLDTKSYASFVEALKAYSAQSNLEDLLNAIDKIFLLKQHQRYLIQGLGDYIKKDHKAQFESYWQNMR